MYFKHISEKKSSKAEEMVNSEHSYQSWKHATMVCLSSVFNLRLETLCKIYAVLWTKSNPDHVLHSAYVAADSQNYL